MGIALSAMVLLTGSAAQAAFPGKNGRIAYSFDSPNEFEAAALYTVNPDGTDKRALTPMYVPFLYAATPSWFPDGTKIVFGDGCCTIYTANADGSSVTAIVEDSLDALDPAWSPDGTKIAYSNLAVSEPSNQDIYTMNPDGTGEIRLTFDPATDVTPAWSPDGARIAFVSDRGPSGIWVMAADGSAPAFVTAGSNPNWSPDASKLVFDRVVGTNREILISDADGSDEVRLTNYSGSDATPAWSPDRSKIGWVRDGWLYTMNSDGTSQTRVTATRDFGEESQTSPDWQPLPDAGYPRPKGAGPVHMSLVPRYMPCISPNRTHGPPLAFGSCNPPERSSTYLTVGTPDANGQPAKSTAYVRFDVQAGNPATPVDEADIALNLSASDVRLASDLSDYTGTLSAEPTLRVTDKDNTPRPGGPGPGTVTDFMLPFSAPCVATADATIGARCTASTSVEALAPGAVKEKTRAIWQLERFEVGDGGPQASPVNRPFLVPGLFVP